MDPNTGKIYRNIDETTAVKHGLVEIPPEEEKQVQAMNRHQRRAWAAKQRRKEVSDG